ncbi:MAG: glycosyltransferase family 39 protein [Gammaproteobacteria bacterium]|nr:glycosyltransferase family 39 protein [Gammaproteobacteria bacterium]
MPVSERPQPASAPTFWPHYGWLLLWLAPVVTGFLLRGPWPIDETRYLAVAWEMWQRGEWLVPYLNGEPYSHKPPLLFWSFHLGWWLFGVNDWWPRLVPALAGLGCLLFTRQLARQLWPGDLQTPRTASWLLAGSLYWAAFTPLVMFDMLLTACVLLALLGLWRAGQGHHGGGWVMLALAGGLGALVKGPFVALPVFAPALLFFAWRPGGGREWPRWFAGLALAALGAAALLAAWLIPALAAGGPEYSKAVLWGQVAGRVSESFAHARPVWWYLVWAPVLLLPWSLWPGVWRRHVFSDPGTRFLWLAVLPSVLLLSLVSGKQPHYLLPLLPLLALLVARAGGSGVRWPALPLWLLALAPAGWLLAWLLAVPLTRTGPYALPVLWAALVLLVLIVGALITRRAAAPVPWIATTVVLGLLLAEAGVFPRLRPDYDLRPAAQKLAELERAGLRATHLGKYHGQYHFAGRLRQPFQIAARHRAADWPAAGDPTRVLIGYGEPPPRLRVVFRQPYRGDQLWIAQAP